MGPIERASLCLQTPAATLKKDRTTDNIENCVIVISYSIPHSVIISKKQSPKLKIHGCIKCCLVRVIT
jgi:hypothetical protein